MKKLSWLLLLSLYSPAAVAQFDGCPPGFCSPQASGFTAACTESNAFLARTTGLNSIHQNAYDTMICGLVTDGVWSKFDFFYVPATQNSTTALLNLVSSSFPLVLTGAPTFTVDRGFTGVNASAGVYANTQFNPATAPSPKATQNSTHLSTWTVTDLYSPTGSGYAISLNNSNTQFNMIIPKDTSGNATFNAMGTGGTYAALVQSAVGHYVSNRSGASATEAYKAGVSIATGAGASGAVPNGNVLLLTRSVNGTPQTSGMGGTLSAATMGSSLTAGNVTSLYSRLGTYMTAVGAEPVPCVKQWYAGSANGHQISNNGLTAISNTGGGGIQFQDLCSKGPASGKYYFEMTPVEITGGGSSGFGLSTTTASYSSLGLNATGGSIIFYSGAIYANGGNSGFTLGSIATRGAAVGVAVDLVNYKIWYRKTPAGLWNGNASADPATNVNGANLPNPAWYNPVITSNGLGNGWTINIGGSTYAGTPPSGFGNW